MAEYIGYTALLISLLSLNMNSMLSFRYLHLLASIFYFSYGLMIGATSLAVGATLFALIHSYRIYRIYNPPPAKEF